MLFISFQNLDGGSKLYNWRTPDEELKKSVKTLMTITTMSNTTTVVTAASYSPSSFKK